jgi:hypothetical protein
MNKNYKIKSELYEDQVEADIASYLGLITPLWSKRLRLIRLDEQETGADKLFDRFMPMYLQFKVSHGLKPLNKNFQASKPDRPLQKIRIFRRDKKLLSNPLILYFKLRNIAKGAEDFQHNILLSFNQPPKQTAMYLAPLVLTNEEYEESLRSSIFNRLFPRNNPFYKLETELFESTGKITLGLIPFLRGHISITPHLSIDTSEHYYSYSKNGRAISWHSGKILKDQNYRLSNQLELIFNEFYYNKNSGFRKQAYVDYIKNLQINEWNIRKSKLNVSDEELIVEFVKFLKSAFNIILLFLSIDNTDGTPNFNPFSELANMKF